MTQWSPGDVLMVLGAGATRGAEFVESRSRACLPPLNMDFFTQLQRVATKKHQETINAVLNFRVALAANQRLKLVAS